MLRNLLLLSLVSTAAIASAMPSNLGTPVKKIPFASQISDWEVIDRHRVIVGRPGSKTYLLTFRDECHELTFSNRLGVSSSNNTIYAGFDYVTAGHQRCPIQHINLISQTDRSALAQS